MLNLMFLLFSLCFTELLKWEKPETVKIWSWKHFSPQYENAQVHNCGKFRRAVT